MRRLFYLVVILSGIAALTSVCAVSPAYAQQAAQPPATNAAVAPPVLEEVTSNAVAPPAAALATPPSGDAPVANNTPVTNAPITADPADDGKQQAVTQPVNTPVGPDAAGAAADAGVANAAATALTPEAKAQGVVATPPAAAITNDSVVAPPVLPPPGAMPPQPAADESLEGMSNNPGMNIPTGDAELQALENDPAVLEASLREEAYDASINGLMPLRPNEIKSFLRTYDETQAAVESPLDAPPKPEMGITTVSLDPGTAPAEVDLAVGNVTTLNIVDISGQPWPIQDIGWAGNFEILQPETGSHVLRITPISQYAYGNLSVRLVGLNTPIILTLKTNKDSVYYRLDIRVPDFGPKATPPIIDAGITTKAGDKTLTSVLEGVMPEGAEKMVVEGIDGRTTAYALDGQTYVRTPYTLLSPAWMSSVKSADGMNVYAIEATPVLLLSDRGKMVRATLREKVEDTNEF